MPSNLSEDEDQDTHPSDKTSSNVIIKKQRIASLRPHSLTTTISKSLLATILHLAQLYLLQAGGQVKKREVRTSRLGWIIDSGAGVHVCNDLRLLNNIKRAHTTWRLADGSYLDSTIMGDLGNIGQCIYVPSADTGIISVKSLNKMGYSVSLNSNATVTVTRDGTVTQLGLQYIDDLLITVDEFEGLRFDVTISAIGTRS
jgi:hypothetical protein